MGSDTCKRYKRLAVSGWEHNRGRGESKLREMKPDPIERADDRVGHPYLEATGGFSGLKLASLDYDETQDRGYPSRRGLGSSGPRLFVLIKKTKSIQGILLRLRQLRYSMKAQQ